MGTRINTSPLVRTYTLEEFWELPDPPDRLKLELIAGVIYVSPPPDHIHEDVVSRLSQLLTMHLIETEDKGSLYVPRAAIWSDSQTHLEPDLFYVSAELAARLKPNRRETADLVLEVVLPESAIYDRNTKAETYAALGVRELWLIDETAETVEVRRQAGGGIFDEGRAFSRGESVESAVFPTFRLAVEQLFAD
jgi:Uma2 family endonuclease